MVSEKDQTQRQEQNQENVMTEEPRDKRAGQWTSRGGSSGGGGQQSLMLTMRK